MEHDYFCRLHVAEVHDQDECQTSATASRSGLASMDEPVHSYGGFEPECRLCSIKLSLSSPVLQMRVNMTEVYVCFSAIAEPHTTLCTAVI